MLSINLLFLTVSTTKHIPFALLASVYRKPEAWPVFLPISPCKLGPTLCLPPDSTV